MPKFAQGSSGVILSITSILILQAFAFMAPPAFGIGFPSITVGQNPSAIAINNSTHIAYIANNGSNSVSLLSGQDFFVFMTLPVGSQPMGIAVNYKTNLIYVANNGSNTVTVINASTNSFTSMSVGNRPVSIAINPTTNKTYVANNDSSSVTVIPSMGSPFTISGAPYSFNKPVGIAVNTLSNQNRTYVANSGDNSLTVIPKAGSAYKLSGSPYNFNKPVSIAINPTTNMTYIANNGTNNITIIKTDNTVSQLTVQNNPVSIAVNPFTNRTYIVNQGSNSVTVIKGSVVPNIIYHLTGFNKPVSIAIDPFTNSTYIVNRGNNTVSVIPGDTGGFNSALPTAPRNLQIAPGNGQVTLTWNPPFYNGTTALTGYTIQKSTNFGQTFTTVFSGSVNNASKIISGLTNNVPVIFRVNATNGGGTGPAAFPIFAVPSTNPVGQFIAPPAPPPAAVMTAMIALGLPPNFIMPSPLFVPSGSFNPFSAAITVQNLTFTTKAPVISKTLFTDYSVQSYSPPSNWDANTVWSVPPQVAPLSNDPGAVAMFKLSQATKGKPFFLPVSGAKSLPGGGILKGVKIALGENASNLQVASQFLNSPPQGLPTVPNAAMYLNFSLTDNNGINFGDPSQFASLPSVSFSVPPISGSISPVSPTNTVNSGITCPNVQLLLLSAGGSSGSGLTVVRDTSGDTASTCGYTATLQHFSSYGVSGILSTSSRGAGGSTPGAPPSFSTGFAQNEYPLTINGNNYKLSNYVNTGPTSTITLGTPFTISVLLRGDNGPQSVKHVSLVTNIRGNYASIVGADTILSWDAAQPLQISDPNHFFGPITADATVVDNKFQVTLHGTFVKPMPLSDIGIRTWGYDTYSQDIYVTNALQSTASVETTKSTLGTTQSSQTLNPTPSTTNPSTVSNTNTANDLVTSVKEWAGYSPTAISDSQMLQSMGYQGTHVPIWVMKGMAKYLVDGSITQDDFAGAIKYLVDNHIIR